MPDFGFQFECIPFELHERKLKQWVLHIIADHDKKPGDLNFIFCTDDQLLEINRQYLNHDYYTDIISFPLDEKKVGGELYISIDRVRENAKTYKIDFELELFRVMIHGILHFLGYKDKTTADKKKMRAAEDAALEFLQNEFIKRDHYFDKVYDLVRCIPKGKVCTYGALADYLSLGSARMVGWALNQLKGRVSEVPAHRVINVKGELSGRMMFGDGGERMGRLLQKEGVHVENYRVAPLEKYFWSPMELDKIQNS